MKTVGLAPMAKTDVKLNSNSAPFQLSPQKPLASSQSKLDQSMSNKDNLTRNNLCKLDVAQCSKSTKNAEQATDRSSDDGKSDLSTEVESPRLKSKTKRSRKSKKEETKSDGVWKKKVKTEIENAELKKALKK